MQILETLFYFIVTLGVLVFVHEFGHFIAAKIFRMRVDRFSIGFPPRAFGKKIGETDYCVSWIPIGGYVKIAGMIDESFDTDYLSKPAEPWEFRSKPIWQRIVVISAGVIMNLILAFAIFWGITYLQERTIRLTTVIGHVVDASPAADAGLHEGDTIVAVNHRQVRNWEDVLNEVYLQSGGTEVPVTVRRAGAESNVTVRRVDLSDPNAVGVGILPEKTELTVGIVEPGFPAAAMGLKPGDVFLSIGGSPVHDDQKVRSLIRSSAGKPLAFEWKRGDSVMAGTTTPTTDGRIGISFGVRYYGPSTSMRYGFFESFPYAVTEIATVTRVFVYQMGQLVTGKTAFSQSVGGPIKIAQMATQSAEMGVAAFFGFMAMLSISLAFLNILPIPALDGGHLIFLLYEGIFRREIPVKVKIGIQRAGFLLLLAFMAFVLYNDIRHF